MTRSRWPGSMDDTFLQRIEDVIVLHLSDPDFDTRQVASAAGISRMHLNRRLRALTGQSSREFIRIFRLRSSLALLRQADHRVCDVALQVGFRSVSHFAKVFREEFGVTPSQYRLYGARSPHSDP